METFAKNPAVVFLADICLMKEGLGRSLADHLVAFCCHLSTLSFHDDGFGNDHLIDRQLVAVIAIRTSYHLMIMNLWGSFMIFW